LHLNLDVRYSSLSFVRLSWGRTTHKVAINWQNLAQVELQLKFAFKIRPFETLKLSIKLIVNCL